MHLLFSAYKTLQNLARALNSPLVLNLLVCRVSCPRYAVSCLTLGCASLKTLTTSKRDEMFSRR